MSRWGCSEEVFFGFFPQKLNETQFCADDTRAKSFNHQEFSLLAGTKDLLNALEVRALPLGVTLVEGRPAAFTIDPSAELHAPLSSVFKRRLPKRFSIVAAIKPKENNAGFLLTISDIDGKVKLAIQVGSNPTFQYSDDSALSRSLLEIPAFDTSGVDLSVRFPVELSDGDWHYIGYSIDGSTIRMYKDCDLILTKKLRKNKRPKTGPNSVITLGKSLKQSSDLYHHYEVSFFVLEAF